MTNRQFCVSFDFVQFKKLKTQYSNYLSVLECYEVKKSTYWVQITNIYKKKYIIYKKKYKPGVKIK